MRCAFQHATESIIEMQEKNATVVALANLRRDWVEPLEQLVANIRIGKVK